ncbi:MAG TPA: O-antigen ligase family protein [Leptospiraceae bacterium]|nr:O-antigen ligase family protein [Leptospiraceae bacterium]
MSFPVSISLSQAGISFAAIAWIAGIVARSDVPRFPWPRLLIAGLCIYGLELLSLIFLSFSGGGLAFIKQGLSREIKDVFLILMAFWVFAFSEDEDRRKTIEKLTYIAIGILIVSGLIGIFSRYRLSNIPYHLMHGWEGNMQARYQHHAGTFLAGTPLMFHIYLPVGFLHSHLTYGALLMMAMPILFLRAMNPIIRYTSDSKKQTLIAIMIFGAACVVFMINNARSAILGTIFVIALTVYYYSRFHWKKKALYLLIPAVIALLAFGGLFIFADLLHERLRALVIALSGQQKHTDYQRVLLWNASWEVIRSHPWLGVGAGHFQESVESILLNVSKQHPGLWYANETLQRGHSHSDPLHILAIAGIPAFISYIVFFAMLIHRAIKPAGRAIFRFGAPGLLIAGLYQCYFLDDAVLLPFWLLVGLTLRETETGQTSAKS